MWTQTWIFWIQSKELLAINNRWILAVLIDLTDFFVLLMGFFISHMQSVIFFHPNDMSRPLVIDSSHKQYFFRKKTILNYKSPFFSIEQIMNLVIYGFKDSTGLNVPNESINSSSESSLNRSRRESSSSIRTGFDSIAICSSIIGQLDSSKISSGLSSHCFHSNP